MHLFRRVFGELTGKLLSSRPYNITIGSGTRFMDVSVTNANLIDAAVQFGCKLATHCSVLV